MRDDVQKIAEATHEANGPLLRVACSTYTGRYFRSRSSALVPVKQPISIIDSPTLILLEENSHQLQAQEHTPRSASPHINPA